MTRSCQPGQPIFAPLEVMGHGTSSSRGSLHQHQKSNMLPELRNPLAVNPVVREDKIRDRHWSRDGWEAEKGAAGASSGVRDPLSKVISPHRLTRYETLQWYSDMYAYLPFFAMFCSLPSTIICLAEKES
jgi:hypothetical protein